MDLNRCKAFCRDLFSHPIPSTATLSVDRSMESITAKVLLCEEQQDINLNTTSSFVSHVTVSSTSNGEFLNSSPFAPAPSGFLSLSESNCDGIFCYLRQVDSDYIFDFYSTRYLFSISHPTSSKIHTTGPLVRSGVFHWINSHQLLFVADEPSTLPKDFLDNLDAFIHKPTLGESSESRNPALWICDLETKSTWQVKLSTQDIIPVDAVPSPDGSMIALSSLSLFTRGGSNRGFHGCPNTPSRVYLCQLPSTPMQHVSLIPISPPAENARSPRWSPCGKRIVYLKGDGEVHQGICSLIQVNLTNEHKIRDFKTLLPVSKSKSNESANHNKVQGIWTTVLPYFCYSSDGLFIFFTSELPFRKAVFRLCVRTGQVAELSCLEETNLITSTEVISVVNDVLLIKESSFWSLPRFHLLIMSSCLSPTSSVGLGRNVSVFRHSNKVTHKLINHQSRDGHLFHSLLLQSNYNSSLFPKSNTLAVIIHGGPRAQIVSSYTPYIASLLDSGVSVLIPNYPGSSGYSKQCSESLTGRIGDVDVNESYSAVKKVTSSHPNYTKIHLIGGSHGGFVILHMISKWGKEFASAIVRNPVVDLYSNLNTSDIPNWTLVETGFAVSALPTIQMINNLIIRSPINFFDQITTPVAFHLGLNDQRVPPHQSLALYHMLKSRGQEVKCFTYEKEGHSLNSPRCQSLFAVNCVRFINDHNE
ncbi:hypothetical protein P9112_012937 [Eukaryota sp. TZLM1-RC]